jgi:hypothetical protein
VTDATGFISKNRELQITSTEQGMRIEGNPLAAEVSASCIPSSRRVQLHLSRARKIQSWFYRRSLECGQAARFSKGDVIATSPVDLFEFPTFLFPQLTKSVLWCFLSRPEAAKAVRSEAAALAETVQAIVEFDENKCREKQSGSDSGVIFSARK